MKYSLKMVLNLNKQRIITCFSDKPPIYSRLDKKAKLLPLVFYSLMKVKVKKMKKEKKKRKREMGRNLIKLDEMKYDDKAIEASCMYSRSRKNLETNFYCNNCKYFSQQIHTC